MIEREYILVPGEAHEFAIVAWVGKRTDFGGSMRDLEHQHGFPEDSPLREIA